MITGGELAAESLSFQYAGAALRAVDDLTLRVDRGQIYAVIGPNGSGKSTLARLLLGTLRPASGRALYDGIESSAWDRRALARRIGVVSQGEEIVFPVTVRALAGMGRYPHMGAWRGESAADLAAVARALEACDVAHLADRYVTQLSGGERQRARIARALAQEPGTLVLDEPTAALDIAHEMSIFDLLGRLRAEHGVTVLLVTHNINLAARYADRMLLLERGRAVAEGPPAAVVTRERIERSYQWPVEVFQHPGPGPHAGAPQVTPLSRSFNTVPDAS